MNILGISCFYHDAAAALLRDGELIAGAEEERFSRKKHDHDFPEQAIAFCLQQGGLRGQDLDYVVFHEKPLVKFERILSTVLGTYPKSSHVFREAMATWFNEKLWIKGLLLRKLNVPQDCILFSEHHLSHAASALFCSPFTEAAILTVDGVGEWSTSAMGRGQATWDGSGANRIELSHEIRFPHSLGLLYSAFTAFLGFEVNEGEYKVMGMAPYGKPRYMDQVYKLLEVADDGSFRLNMEYFSFHRSTEHSYSGRFVELFGPPRQPGADFRPADSKESDLQEGDSGPLSLDAESQRYADIAASIQRVTEEVLLKMTRHLQRTTGLKKLCMAGGVIFNSVANGRILRETDFDDVFIQPAAGDAGAALGAALWAYHVLLQRPRTFVMNHCSWGQGFSEAQVADYLHSAQIPHERFDDQEKMLDRVVANLTQGKVLGWFQGRFEWGPRALGNRSILADPRRAEMKTIVNEKIKFREPFRPFAPAILEERSREYFDLPEGKGYGAARFMQFVAPIVPEKQSAIPAVNHRGTGRLQTIERRESPLYYRLVEKFGQATGVPVLLNTSYNLRGEPIVTSPANAYRTFQNSGLDLLAMENFLIGK